MGVNSSEDTDPLKLEEKQRNCNTISNQESDEKN